MEMVSLIVIKLLIISLRNVERVNLCCRYKYSGNYL